MSNQDPSLSNAKPIQANPVKKKSKAGRSLSTVNLDRLEKASKTILQREINNLLDASHKGKLSKDDSASLRDYIKTIRELKKDQTHVPEAYEVD